MENIIKKAIEGGYKLEKSDAINAKFHFNKAEINGTFCISYLHEWHPSSGPSKWEEDRKHFRYSEILLDPLLWQALGKACGWNMNPKSIRFGETSSESLGEHIDYALRFHEINLTEGWDKAVAYLEDLIK